MEINSVLCSPSPGWCNDDSMVIQRGGGRGEREKKEIEHNFRAGEEVREVRDEDRKCGGAG